MSTLNDPNVTLFDDNLDIVDEIDKFLKEYNSVGAKRLQLSNLSNELDDEFLKNLDVPEDVPNLKVNSKTGETSGLDFVGQNPAVFHLEGSEEFGTYDYNQNEINWNIFDQTLPPDEQNHGEFKNDGFISNSVTISKTGTENVHYSHENIQDSNVEQTMIDAEQFPTNKQNHENNFSEVISNETILFDELKKVENFSFSQYCNNNQKYITTTENSYETLANSSTALDEINNKTGTQGNVSLSLDKNDNIQNNSSNQQSLKRKNNKKYDNSVPWKKPCEKPNYRKSDGWNQKKTWDRNIHGFEKRKPLKFNSQKKCSSSLPINEINYSDPKTPFTRSINSELQSSKPFLSGISKPAKKMQDKNRFDKDMPPYMRINQGYENSNVGNYRPAFNNIEQTYGPSTSKTQFPNDVNGSHYSLNPYDLNKQKIHKQHSNLPHYEFNQYSVQKHCDSSILPVQQNSFHDPNLQNSQVCHDDKEKVICISQEKKENTKRHINFVLHHVIKDYLCPASLVGCTIKFISRKLANTCIRNELNVALNSYGRLKNSWWTPDDKFFATFSSRSVAQHVYKIYPKNRTSSY